MVVRSFLPVDMVHRGLLPRPCLLRVTVRIRLDHWDVRKEGHEVLGLAVSFRIANRGR